MNCGWLQYSHLFVANTAHRRGFRVVAQFIGGELSKAAQTIPDWAAKVFGKELRAAKQHEKPGRGR
ncbi:MAG: hypothetical protein DMG41_24160 [Acidobacteria bacterium]|nr:MAG: hypothetical protein AUH01_02080 [Acidobacteria bacterium 13_2_20CM_56_17]PYT76531.1 MAG: hypothetical protein DMG42_04930 [Acidobacteriota bacterium]PYT85291.1 MAG: hypothetical protein DMG41_24160 [Acidobacteriota bacterium]